MSVTLVQVTVVDEKIFVVELSDTLPSIEVILEERENLVVELSDQETISVTLEETENLVVELALGSPGRRGEKGDKGDIGPIGLTGPIGPRGLTGLTGPQGPIGLTGAVGPVGPIGSTSVEFRRVTHAEAIAQRLALEATPPYPAKTRVFVIGGTAQKYGFDFTIVGQELIWSGYSLETTLGEGDDLLIEY